MPKIIRKGGVAYVVSNDIHVAHREAIAFERGLSVGSRRATDAQRDEIERLTDAAQDTDDQLVAAFLQLADVRAALMNNIIRSDTTVTEKPTPELAA